MELSEGNCKSSDDDVCVCWGRVQLEFEII